MLQINNASKTFDKTQILHQINFTVQANSVVGLVGPSGSGKSTLLRCIQQLESLDSGTIDFKGRSGFMFQDFQLFPHMTVLENLVYAPTLHDKATSHEEHAKQLLGNLGLNDKTKGYPHQLSGGQKQRVALARSLMMKPDLLLCDEPTSGLDMVTTSDVIFLLNTVKNMNVTMLIASHDLPFLTQIAERILVLRHGRLIADLNPAEIADPVTQIKAFYQGEIV